MSLYLSNWASHRTPGMHGPGYAPLTIMARPRHFERGAGRVMALIPTEREIPLLMAALANRDDEAAVHAYRAALEARWATMALAPGMLMSRQRNDSVPRAVLSGMTLCCACSRAEAAAGRCHRAWAAPFLARAGWTVVLDGAPYTVPA